MSEEARIPMLGVKCKVCLRPWFSTADAVAKWPHCPFCGADKLTITPVEIDATGGNGERS